VCSGTVRSERAGSTMASNKIPDDLRRFILTSVPSVPYLEAVLLLRRQPDDDWTPDTVARNLYLPQSQAGAVMAALETAGIAVKAEGSKAHRYGPPPELAALLDRVAHLYAQELVAVTELIHSSIDRRAFQFADAFRLRKDS
jgi:hypothetical protein